MNVQRVYLSCNKSGAENLALEEWFLDNLAFDEGIFLVYLNNEAVVIGKNQNPWKEANLDFLKKEKIPLFRRISGGGTVFHDPGNLNYSFIQPRKEFSKDENLEILREFFSSFVPDLILNERGDLLQGDYKFSGNALAYRKNHVLHHGTILFKANQERLRASLNKANWTKNFIKEKSVESVPRKTINIASFAPYSNPLDLGEALLSFIAQRNQANFKKILTLDTETEKIQAYRAKYYEKTWNLGRSPEFELQISEDLGVRVCEGMIRFWLKNGKEYEHKAKDYFENPEQALELYQRSQSI